MLGWRRKRTDVDAVALLHSAVRNAHQDIGRNGSTSAMKLHARLLKDVLDPHFGTLYSRCPDALRSVVCALSFEGQQERVEAYLRQALTQLEAVTDLLLRRPGQPRQIEPGTTSS